MLEAAGNVKLERDGKQVARKRIVASLAWELLTTGEAILPNGKALHLDPQDWLGLYKWIYQHIDGPPKTEVDVTSGGQALAVEIGIKQIDYRTAITETETGSGGDRETPGQDKSPVDGTQVG